MKKIEILGVEFLLTQIGSDKLILQQKESKKNKSKSIPYIGQVIFKKKLTRLENIVAAESELLIYCQEEYQEKLINKLQLIEAVEPSSKTTPLFIDVCFDFGLDWERVCKHIGITKEAIIKQILKGSYPLINYGFQPGFMYLDSLKPNLQVPRLENPRLKVPAGSLAIGAKYLGIYGNESPGGWNIVGLTPHLYQKNDNDFKQVEIGQEIKFNRLDKNKYLRKHNE